MAGELGFDFDLGLDFENGSTGNDQGFTIEFEDNSESSETLSLPRWQNGSKQPNNNNEQKRYERINKVFVDTGFWDYVETLNLNVEDYEKAIDLAPSIKPNRHVYLHEEEHRKHAKMVLRTDEMLKRVFHL